MSRPLRVALVGGGAIGSTLLRLARDGRLPGLEFVALVELDPARAKTAAGLVTPAPKMCALPEAVRLADVVVEAAGRDAVADIFAHTLPLKKPLVVLSVGAFAERLDLLEQARTEGAPVYLASGAVLGIDGLKAAMVGGVNRVTLTSTKPPAGFKGAPLVVEKKIVLDGLKAPLVLFEGSAREAIKGFPANVNVCVTVALAGLGVDRTQVRVVADPGAKRNRHHLKVEGTFGMFEVVTENLPVPDAPKTSALAAYAAAAVLRRLADPVVIGT